jgi:hypothetical protein
MADAGDMPSEEERARVAALLLEILKREGYQLHQELMLLAHTLACCAVAAGCDETLLVSLVRARYSVIAHHVRPGERPRAPETLEAVSPDDTVRIGRALTEELDRHAVAHNQVWLLLHTLCSHAWAHGVPFEAVRTIAVLCHKQCTQVGRLYKR